MALIPGMLEKGSKAKNLVLVRLKTVYGNPEANL